MRTGFKQNVATILAIQAVLLWAGCDDALGLGISPGAFCAQGVPVGEKIDTGVDITVTNNTDKERIFSLTIVEMTPLQSPSLRGYSSMPDLSWFMLEKTELTVPANGQATSRITLSIPDDESYYNQHWGVSCLVEYAGQKGLFQEAVKAVYMVETKSRENLKGRPHGRLGLAPTIVSINPHDKRAVAGFTIYNNTDEARTYTLTCEMPDDSQGNLVLSTTPGFRRLTEPGRLSIRPASVRIRAGASRRIAVSLDRNRDAASIDGTEAVVFVESDRKEARFVRVQIGQPGSSADAADGENAGTETKIKE
ncbi:MAG TPA: hypothetical protein VLH60_06925 [Sedimentisphaerales bacterium]|nr:hypothetical protein [Sedimentisphaerales bacterium]